MSIYQRGETYSQWITIRDRTGTKVDPTTMVITIKDPCSFTLKSAQTMTKSDTGIYFYNYDTIQSAATYGKYTVEMTATAATGQKGIYYDKFYVMPWEVATEVRQITGITEEKDISDDDLSDICWKAYKEALRDVYLHHHEETPGGNPSSGVGFNGTNTLFKMSHYPIADINGDGSITGNNTSCATDMEAYWYDTNKTYNRAVITINNKNDATVNIFQNDGATAIPNTNKGVFVDYWSEYESFDTDIFRNAVVHLAADYLVRRFTEADRVTVVDMSSNLKMIKSDMRDGKSRFYRKYKQIIDRVRKPMIGGV